MKNKCMKCKKVFPDDVIFCSECGEKLVQIQSTTEKAGKWIKTTSKKSAFVVKAAKDTVASTKAAKIMNQKKNEFMERIAGSYAVCDYCGAVLQPDSKFCDSCGKLITSKKDDIICAKCGATLKSGSKFCNECGAPVVLEQQKEENICAKCGAVLKSTSKFCSECGAPVERKIEKTCPNCGIVFDEKSSFCNECGCPLSDNPQDTETNSINYCPNCGEKVESGCMYCPVCGSKIDHEKESSGEMTTETVNSFENEEKAEEHSTGKSCQIFESGIEFDNKTETGKDTEEIATEIIVEEEVLREEIICQNCGTVVDSESLFCPECGSKI